jgi:hypothetical protein
MTERPPAIPSLQHPEDRRRYATCVCDKPIKTSAFGWVHQVNSWVSLGSCERARPKVSVPVVGPRLLPTDGDVHVWLDTGSGFGYARRATVDQLALNPSLDDGEGETAIYDLALPEPSDD